MTTAELSLALDAIEKCKPAAVHAGRKGICVGHMSKGKTIMFRRDLGKIYAELWPSNRSGPAEAIIVKEPLLARAEKLIDR